jgi:hypothetical protein
MKTLDYSHKPKKIKSAKDLLKFVQGIPEKFWCVDTRQDMQGRCCILGHLQNAYFGEVPTDGFTENELATANNGTIDSWRGPRAPKAGIGGRSIKNRLVKFLKANLKRH